MIEAGPCLQSILNTRLYILSACLGAALAFTASASAQSEDEVHVVPRPGTMEASERATDTGRPLGSTNHLKLRPERLRVDVDVVLVPVVVTDTLNRPVTGLTKDSFELLDDGEKQKIHFFSLDDDALSMALVLDISNSMVNRVSVEREALEKLFQNANPEEEYFAVGVSSSP